MTPRQREAHFRMLASLPVRTHLRDPNDRDMRQGIFRGRAIYRGKTYPSLTALRNALRIGYQRAEEMIARKEIRLI